MNRIVAILMKKEGFSKAEAERHVEYCRRCLLHSVKVWNENPAEVLKDILNLGPEYLGDLLSLDEGE